MRNSEARKYARWSLAAAGLLALAVAGVYLRNVFLAGGRAFEFSGGALFTVFVKGAGFVLSCF